MYTVFWIICVELEPPVNRYGLPCYLKSARGIAERVYKPISAVEKNVYNI